MVYMKTTAVTRNSKHATWN